MNWQKDYLKYLPTDQDRQNSSQPYAYTNGCVSFSRVHLLEIKEKILTGNETDYSEQIVCVGSGTDPQKGNTDDNVWNWILNNGLVKTSIAPEPVNFTADQFYSINVNQPQFIKDGQWWKNQWNISKTEISPEFGLSLAESEPVCWIIDLNKGMNGLHDYHAVVGLPGKQYFDSYSTLIKPLNDLPIIWAYQVLLTQKTMPNAEFVNKQGTQEFGYYLPALSEDALKDKALNLGLNILNPDGTINFNLAKQVTGL